MLEQNANAGTGQGVTLYANLIQFCLQFLRGGNYAKARSGRRSSTKEG